MGFGERLKYIIQKLNISYHKFGEKIGAPQQSISQWVAGQRHPRFAKLMAMYEHFGINPGYLLTGHGPMFIEKFRKQPSVSSREEIDLKQRHDQLVAFLEGHHVPFLLKGESDMKSINFGERLKKTIQKLEITQAALATEIGVHRAVVSQWITGRQYPLSENLIAMYEHFGINPGYLLTGQGPMFLKEQAAISLALWHVYMGLAYHKKVPRPFLIVWSRLTGIKPELLLDTTSLDICEPEEGVDDEIPGLSGEKLNCLREIALSLFNLGLAEKLPEFCFLHGKAYWTRCPVCRSLGIANRKEVQHVSQGTVYQGSSTFDA